MEELLVAHGVTDRVFVASHPDTIVVVTESEYFYEAHLGHDDS